jgi:hypothetical protein
VAAEPVIYWNSAETDDLANAFGSMGISGDAQGVSEQEITGFMNSMNIK